MVSTVPHEPLQPVTCHLGIRIENDKITVGMECRRSVHAGNESSIDVMVNKADRLLCRELTQKRRDAWLRGGVINNDNVGELHGVRRQYRIEAPAHGRLTPINGDDDVESTKGCLSHPLPVLPQSARAKAPALGER